MTGSERKSADALLIAALATGAARQEAAKTAGISEAIVYRRLADSAFRRRVSAARAELIDAAVGRLAAARGILELAKRIAALEERIGHQEGRRWAG